MECKNRLLVSSDQERGREVLREKVQPGRVEGATCRQLGQGQGDHNEVSSAGVLSQELRLPALSVCCLRLGLELLCRDVGSVHQLVPLGLQVRTRSPVQDCPRDHCHLACIDAEPVQHVGQLASLLLKLVCLHSQGKHSERAVSESLTGHDDMWDEESEAPVVKKPPDINGSCSPFLLLELLDGSHHLAVQPIRIHLGGDHPDAWFRLIAASSFLPLPFQTP